MEDKYIYDVGVNDGADTAFYLSLGYRVVGSRRAPPMADRLRDQFPAESVPVASRCSTSGWRRRKDSWSSGCRITPRGRPSTASRLAQRHTHRAVIVPTRLFENIIAEHGVPYYCKIDIEGNDSCA